MGASDVSHVCDECVGVYGCGVGDEGNNAEDDARCKRET